MGPLDCFNLLSKKLNIYLLANYTIFIINWNCLLINCIRDLFRIRIIIADLDPTKNFGSDRVRIHHAVPKDVISHSLLPRKSLRITLSWPRVRRERRCRFRRPQCCVIPTRAYSWPMCARRAPAVSSTSCACASRRASSRSRRASVCSWQTRVWKPV